MKKQYIKPCAKERVSMLRQFLCGNSIPSNGEEGAPPYGGDGGEGGWGGFGSKKAFSDDYEEPNVWKY
ncbi:MAG: hypothetical protein II521_03635 [Prevotella sp.]|nr:hypothetical protein [Prevotella sp.]MBQ2495185.1 hypothetical protein [Prevotella sp.]MBQ4030064.1 hypothetical protein [Prevotella sp.]